MAKKKEAETTVQATGSTKVMRCGYQHQYQDKVYGSGMRLFNRAGGKNGSIFRCTVCTAQKS